jgi:N-acetylmuramoyl-L-alanine amidase
MGELIIANQRFNIDANIKNWHETGWDATQFRCIPEKIGGSTKCTDGIHPYGEKAKNRHERRFSTRPALRRYGMNPPLEAVKAVVRQFVLHHDGMYSAASCWNVLHNERGLSCHFLIDNDGTIYQTLDLALCGFHASEFNPISIGVELCNRGDAKKEPHYYDDVKRYPDRREQKTCQIGGSKILAYDFTKPQYASMGDLAKALAKLLPNMPIDYPQDAPGKQAWRSLDAATTWSFKGYIGHYHLTGRKWDPGPFDFKVFCEKLRGTLCFPMWSGKRAPETPDPAKRPEIPESIDELAAVSEELYDANEQRADGGFFPVGPWGDSRLWHGGIHIPGPSKGPPAYLYAAFPGRLVAARMGKDTAIGSVNFVLLRHDLSVGPASSRFYSLYMHLHDELKEQKGQPAWMSKESWQAAMKAGKKGEVVLLDEPIEAGEAIGRFGKAGPTVDGDDLLKSQVHLEIFAEDEPFAAMDPRWQVRDGSDSGRFSDITDINAPIDQDAADGVLSRRELINFFTGSGDRGSLHWYVTYHHSEWHPAPGWSDALRTPADFRAFKPEEIDALVAEQIEPGLWWTDEVSEHTGLPPDGLVYHYHPVTFIRWVNEKILETAADPSMQMQTIDASETSEVTGMTSDAGEDSEGHDGDMISDFDLDPEAADKMIQNQHLVEGYAGEANMLMMEDEP